MTNQSSRPGFQSTLTEELEPVYLARLRDLGAEVEFQPGEFLFRQNEPCERFYLLLSGAVSVEITASGGIIAIQTLGPGDELGWACVLMRNGTPFQARCTSPVRALAIEGPELLEACKGDTQFGFALMYRLLEVVAGRLQATRLQLLKMFSLKLNRG